MRGSPMHRRHHAAHHHAAHHHRHNVDAGRHSEYLYNIPLEVENEVVRIVGASVGELQASQVPMLYKECTGRPLEFKEYGFIKLTDFLGHIESISLEARGASGFIVQLQSGVQVPKKRLEQRKIDECDLDKNQYSRVCFAPIFYEQVTETIRNAFRCALCFELLVCPLITTCGHLFCAKCILTERQRTRQTIKRERYRTAQNSLPADQICDYRRCVDIQIRQHTTDFGGGDNVNAIIVGASPDRVTAAQMLLGGNIGPRDVCCYYWCPVCTCILDWDSSLCSISPKSTGTLESFWRLLAAVAIKCSEDQCQWRGNYGRWFNHAACCDYRPLSYTDTCDEDTKALHRGPVQPLGNIDVRFEALVEKHRSNWKGVRTRFSLHVQSLVRQAALGFLDHPSVSYAGVITMRGTKRARASASATLPRGRTPATFEAASILYHSLHNSMIARLSFWSEDWRQFEMQLRAAARSPTITHRRRMRQSQLPKPPTGATSTPYDSATDASLCPTPTNAVQTPVHAQQQQEHFVAAAVSDCTVVATTTSNAECGGIVEERVSIGNPTGHEPPDTYTVLKGDPNGHFRAGERVLASQFEANSVLLSTLDNSKTEWCPCWVVMQDALQ